MADDIILKVELDGAQEELNNLTLLQEAINALAVQKKALNAEQKKLTKAVEDGTITEKQATEAALDLAEQQVELNLITKQTKDEFRQAENQVIRNNKANKDNSGSLAEMRAELARDQQAYIKLSKAERENEQIGGVLQKRIKAQSDELKALEKDIGITSRSVGDYGSAMNETLPLMGAFGQQIQTVVQNLGQIKTAIGKFSTAQKGMIKTTKGTNSSLRAFRIALISTGIGAIVVALGALVAAFLSTQRGADALTRVIRPLQEVMQSLLGVIQDFSTAALDKAFKDPVGAVKELGKAILDNLINRVIAVPKIIKAAGGAIINSFKLIGLGIKSALADVPLIGTFIDQDELDKDLAEAKKAIVASGKELASASVQLTLGVDEEQQEAALNFLDEAITRGKELDRLQKDLEINAINLRREVEKGNLEFNKQKEIAQNQLLTDEERLAAANKAREVLERTTQLQIDQQNREIELARLKTEANDTDREAQRELAELVADRERIEADAVQKRIELGNQANVIVKQRIAANKKAAIDAEKDEIKAIGAKIDRLKQERQLEQVLNTETAEEKLNAELNLQKKIGDLKLEETRKQAALEAEEKAKGIKDETERAIFKENFINEAVSTVRLENQIALAEKEKEVIAEQELAKQTARQHTEDLIHQGARNSLDLISKNAEVSKNIELQKLQERLDGGLISQKDFEQKKTEIEKSAFEKKKKLDLAVVAIDLAKELSAIAVSAAQHPLNPVTFGAAGIAQAAVLGGIAIAKSAIQARSISSQKFSHGGIIHGASHAFGGVDLGNNQEGEGGEAIINKRSTAKHLSLLSAINQDGGGVPLTSPTPNTGSLAKFQNGGVAIVPGQSQSIDLNDLETRIAAAVGTITVQNVASETTGTANRVQQIQDSASF